MSLIAIVVFAGAFSVVALLVFAFSSEASKESKQVYAALDSALATEGAMETRDKDVSLRKNEMISSIPWLNRKLQEYELAPLLHTKIGRAHV